VRHSPFTVVYDACVLYPAPLRDFLMWLALSGAFRARWSAQIHHEWKRNLLENRLDLTSEQIDRTIFMMNDAVPGAVVTEYEFLIEGLALPDPDDRHVLAVAIRSNASVIVTFNQTDFPATTLEPLGIEAQHPDEFAEYLFDLGWIPLLSSQLRSANEVSSKAPPWM
jgi:predicted nucleic acid-binding protein